MKSRPSVFVVWMLLVATVGGILPAEAHPWDQHYVYGAYTSRWDVQQISWYFDQAYASQGLPFQERAHDAAAAWNNVPDGHVWLNYRGGLTWNADEDCGANGGISVVRWADLPGPAARVWYCHRPQPVGSEWSITAFTITIDSSPEFPGGGSATWYPGTFKGTTTQVDLWSALTHEFGHAIGQSRHFEEADLCPTDAAADHSHSATLCAGVWYGNDTNRRTLEADDIHTMQGAYANPPSPPSTTTTTSQGGVSVGTGGCHWYSTTISGIGGSDRKLRCPI